MILTQNRLLSTGNGGGLINIPLKYGFRKNGSGFRNKYSNKYPSAQPADRRGKKHPVRG